MSHPSDPQTAALIIALDARRSAPSDALCSPDCPVTLDFHAWEFELNSAFQRLLGQLELSMRRALHRELSTSFGREDWWTVLRLRLTPKGQDMLAQALAAAGRSGKPVLEEINFGFWVSLTSAGRGEGGHDYETNLWRPIVHKAFPGYHGKRRDLHETLDFLRILRNDVAHHRPIHHRHLEADQVSIYRVLSHIHADSMLWLLTVDQVPTALTNRPRACPDSRAA